MLAGEKAAGEREEWQKAQPETGTGCKLLEFSFSKDEAEFVLCRNETVGAKLLGRPVRVGKLP